ncbi:LPXTG cell wall anchor domain-containing protein [Pontibacillus yanchengensis]|uniref:LPXTG cell wall anchor domain-containing protein n=1 Tax=Pontibacillus yanchengensis TaxID=462910 RepID=A0ACC7VH86_9BACI|nr:LPXTG cell wall anchor domain-containing protein [Pontibacillus yanchengensis]MYL54338.1 LPXTG cell wall anchor domain-containing protein [Pontibacillus yanchengensis]
MIKLNNLIKFISVYCLFMLLLNVIIPYGETGATTNSPIVNISTLPQDHLFQISNIKPGDTINRTVKVKNDGNTDFYYNLSSEYKSGSELFYKQLLLKVSQGDNILFNKKLSEFTGLEARSLSAFESEDLSMKVEFPYESGNEFQGLTTSVAFTFVAEGKGTPPPPTSSDPNLDITLSGSCELATATFENNSKKRSTIKPTYELRYSETDNFTTSEKIELENQKSISLKKGESDSINFTPTKTGYYKISAKHADGKELSNELYADMTDCDNPPPEPQVDVELSSLFSGTCEEMTLSYTNESDSDVSISPSYEVYWKESGDAKQGVKITQYDQTDRFSVDQGDSHTLTMKPELPGNYVVKTTYELDGETVEMWSESVTIPTNCDSDVPEDPEDPGDPGDETPETPDNPGDEPDEPGDDGDPEQPGEPGDGDDGKPDEPGEPGDGDEGDTPTPSSEPTPEDGSLPQTGEAAPTAFYIIGSLLMLGGATLYGITYRRRKIE